VVQQQDPNCFSSYARRQPSLDGLLGDQAHRPTGESGGRVATNHGNDALLLLVVQDGSGAWALLFVKSAFQPVLLVTANQIADGLRAETGRLGDLWGAGAIGEVKECEDAEDYADLLDAALEQLAQCGSVGFGELQAKSRPSHSPVWLKTELYGNV
jgi:hypothetical protein